MTKTIFFLGLGGYFLLTEAIYWGPWSGAAVDLLRNILYLVGPAVAVLSGVWLVRVFGWGSRSASSLLLLTMGIGSWFVGEVIWMWYQLILQTDPFPSLADLFYLVGYPLLAVSLWREIGLAGGVWTRQRTRVVIWSTLVGAMLGFLVFFLRLTSGEAGASLFEHSVAIAYAVGDVILLAASFVALLFVREYRGGRKAEFWLVLGSGFMATLVADTLFAIYTQEYEAGMLFYRNVLDALWIAGYILFAIAFVQLGWFLREVQHRVKKKLEIDKGGETP